MHIRELRETELSDFLDKAIEVVYSRGDWYSIFPEMSGYEYLVPDGYGDLEEYPTSVRNKDHAIAHETVKYPELHPKVKELIKIVTVGNAVLDEVLMASLFEHTGTSYAVELALFDKQYVIQYADFLFTNDLYFERFQRFDFTSIIRKWGWSYETFYLLFVRWISESEYASEDIDYLNYNGIPLSKGLLDDEQIVEEFFKAMKDFFIAIAFDAKDEKLTKYAFERLGILFSKHIYCKKEEKERIECLTKRLSLLFEELRNGEKEELSIENEEEGNLASRQTTVNGNGLGIIEDEELPGI